MAERTPAGKGVRGKGKEPFPPILGGIPFEPNWGMIMNPLPKTPPKHLSPDASLEPDDGFVSKVQCQISGLEEIYSVADAPNNHLCFVFSCEKTKQAVEAIFGKNQRLLFPEIFIPGHTDDEERCFGITLDGAKKFPIGFGQRVQNIIKEIGEKVSSNEPFRELSIQFSLPKMF